MPKYIFFLLFAFSIPIFPQNSAHISTPVQEPVVAALADDTPNDFFHNFDNKILIKILTVIYVIIIGLIIIRIINAIIKKSLKNKLNERSRNLIVRIIQYSGLGIIALNILKILNIDLTPLLGAAGVAGIAIGFAAQTSVSNFISGLFLLSEKLFATGDLVTINDITGIVYSIDTLSIKIRTFDNKLIRIANTNVISSMVINITRFPVRRINLIFTVPHQTDIQMVKSLLLTIAASQPTVLENPPPFFMLNGITRDGLELFLGVWMDVNDWEPTYMGMYTGILQEFPKAGIAFSRFEVHIDGTNGNTIKQKSIRHTKQ